LDGTCIDTNPGTLHLLLANLIGIERKSFVFDRTFDDEVWNQPLRGYRIKKQQQIDAMTANRLIGVTTTGATTVNRTGTVAKDVWAHQGSFPVTAGSSAQVVMTGTGDADLYVRKNAAPTSTSYDCRPYANGSNESCAIAGPAIVYVGINGYAASSTYSLELKYKEGTAPVPGDPPPAVFTHVNQTGAVAQGEMKVFPLDIPAGKKVVVRTTAPNDVDLYIMMGTAPTTSAYTARGYTSSGNETITYTATSNGKLYIGVHGYAASSFTVKTTDI
jgi:hypothetical protein